MFFSNVNQGLEILAQSEFKNDEIRLKLNMDVFWFLCSHPDFTYDMDILILKKNISNSVGNKVNPEFIEKLKKITICFLNCLAINWTEFKKEKSLVTLQNKSRDAKEQFTPHSCLWGIISHYNLSTKFSTVGSKKHLIVTGQVADLFKLMIALRREEIQSNNIPASHLLMCAKKDPEWINKQQWNQNIMEYIVKFIYLLTSQPFKANSSK